MALTWPNYSVTIGTKGPLLNPQAVQDLLDLSGGHPERIGLRFQAPISLLNGTGFAAYDNAVQQCNTAGLPILLTVKKFPDPAPGTVQEIAAFAMLLASRYDGKHGHGIIQGLDIGNEDYQYSDFGQLADTMLACYTQIKSSHPDLLVLPGCTLQRNSSAMKAAVAVFLQKAGHACDGLNIHTYFGIPASGPHTPEDGSVANVPSFPQYVQNINDVCTQATINMDIYCTEFGFACSPVNHGNVVIFSQADQATHLLYCIDQARKLGVKHMSVFTLGYATPAPDGMSLVQIGGQKTLAYQQLKSYIAQYPTWGSVPVPPPDPGPPASTPTAEQIAQAVADVQAARAALTTQLQAIDAKLADALAQLQPAP